MYKNITLPVVKALKSFIALNNALNFSTFDLTKNKDKLYPDFEIKEEDFQKENIKALMFKVIDYYIALEQKTPIILGDSFFIQYNCETFKLEIIYNLLNGYFTIKFKNYGEDIYVDNPTLSGLLTEYFLGDKLPEDQKLIVSSYLKYKFDEKLPNTKVDSLLIDFFKLENAFSVKMQNPLELNYKMFVKRKEATNKIWDEQDGIEYFVLKIDKEFFAIKFKEKNSYNIDIIKKMFP